MTLALEATSDAPGAVATGEVVGRDGCVDVVAA